MADSRVVIKIEINADDKAIDRVQRKLAALSAQGAVTSKRLDDMSSSSKGFSKSLNSAGRSVDKFNGQGNKLLSLVSKIGNAFGAAAKFGFKAFIVSLGASVIALLAVNAAFSVGTMAVKAYRASLVGLSAAGASVLTVLAALAAGQREYNAALSASAYGGNMKLAQAQLRGVTSNTRLAVLGAEALNKAFAGISKNARVTGSLNQALTSMGDFAVGSGDPSKALAAAGNFLGLLQKKGSLTKEVQAAGAEVGPQFVEAMKQAIAKKQTSSGDFLKSLVGGDLSKGVAGSLDTLNNTLFGTAKRNFQIIKEDFADFGQKFLPQFTEALQKISNIFRRSFIAIQSSLSRFIGGSFIDGFVGAIDKFGRWTVRMFVEYLPKAEGMISRIGDSFRSIGDWFEKFADTIRPLREGARVIMDAFGPAFRQIFGGWGKGLFTLNDQLTEHRDKLMNFGESIRAFLEGVGELFGQMREAFLNALPALSRIVDMMTTLVGVMTDLTGLLSKTGPWGSLVGFFGLLLAGSGAKSLLGGKPGMASRMFGGSRGGGIGGSSAASTVNMQAGVVYLNGPVSGLGGLGRAGSPWGPPTGPMQPGPGGGPGAGPARAGLGSRFMGQSGAGGLATLLTFGLPLLGSALPFAGAQTAGLLGGGAMMYNSMKPGSTIGSGLQLAAPFVAGSLVGGAGAELFGNSKTAKNMSASNYTMASAGIGVAGGAGAGAATGAALTAWLGPGAALGAGAGAIIGGIAGGIAGVIHSGKQKKQARKSAEDFVNAYEEAISAAMGVGDVGKAQSLMGQMEGQKGELAQRTKQVDSFNKKYDEMSKTLRSKVEPAIDKYNANVELLAFKTGMTSEKIMDMAGKLGLDLTEKIENVNTAVTALREVPTFENAQQFRAWEAQAGLDSALTVFQQPILEKQAGEAVDQSGLAIRDILKSGGTVDQATIAQYLMDAMTFEMSNGKTFADAFYQMQGKLSVPGEGMFAPGMQFTGGETQLMGPMNDLMKDALKGYISTTPGGSLDTLVSTISTKVSDATGGQVTIDPQKMLQEKGAYFNQLFEAYSATSAGKSFLFEDPTGETKQISPNQASEMLGLLVDELNNLTKWAEDPTAQQPNGKFTDVAAFIEGLSASGLFPAGAVTVSQTKTDGTTGAPFSAETIATVAIAGWTLAGPKIEAVLRGASLSAADAFAQKVAAAIAGAGGIMSEGGGDGGGGGGMGARDDTMTPRFGDTSSTLAGTMGRHRSFDSALSGKRSVTSAFRTWGLGSINSDHVTGRAYDLTGQNLGMYKSTVEGAGGFAEFHGGAMDRHLHVVPGESGGPVGDAMMPVPNSGASGSGGGYSSGDAIHFTIESQPQASAEDIANQVMAKLDRRDRNRRERMAPTS